MAPLGARSNRRDQAHSGCYDPRAKGILSQAQAESRTITDLIKVAETYALLAVAEALQFSLVKIARGPAADSCAKSRSAFRIRAFLPVQVRGRGSASGTECEASVSRHFG